MFFCLVQAISLLVIDRSAYSFSVLDMQHKKAKLPNASQRLRQGVDCRQATSASSTHGLHLVVNSTSAVQHGRCSALVLDISLFRYFLNLRRRCNHLGATSPVDDRSRHAVEAIFKVDVAVGVVRLEATFQVSIKCHQTGHH